jgi:hypothetical protein
MKWEYNLISFNTSAYKEDVIVGEINKFGKEGWEAVSMTEYRISEYLKTLNGVCSIMWTRILFKRRIK